MKAFPALHTLDLTDEAATLFQQAVTLLQNAGANLTNDDRQDAIALLHLVTTKMPTPFPLADSLLAMLYYELGEAEATETHLSKALEHDPLNFRAQFVSVQVAADELVEMKAKARTAKPEHAIEKWEYEVDEIMGAQMRFHMRVRRLIEVFNDLCARGLYAVEFLYFAHQLLAVGEFMRAHTYSKFSQSPNVYAVIAKAHIENLLYDEDAAKERAAVDEVRLLAQGL
jgi:tetratricopeptide (TPR) repeat protein